MRVHKIQSLGCRHCSKIIQGRRNFKKHIKQHANKAKQNQRKICYLCGQNFDQRSFRRHLRTKHQQHSGLRLKQFNLDANKPKYSKIWRPKRTFGLQDMFVRKFYQPTNLQNAINKSEKQLKNLSKSYSDRNLNDCAREKLQKRMRITNQFKRFLIQKLKVTPTRQIIPTKSIIRARIQLQNENFDKD